MMTKIDFGMMTARAAREALASIGVTGAAADALIRETGYVRHLRRCQIISDRVSLEVQDGAYCPTYGEGLYRLPTGEDGTDGVSLAHQAKLILLADAMGIGGRDGCSGEASARIPALAGLGSGRKQAADGPAWDAARDAVLAWICDSVAGPIDPEDLDPETINPEWRRTLAREGLRVSVGLDPWFPWVHETYGISWEVDPTGWAAVLEQAERDIEAERTAPPCTDWGGGSNANDLEGIDGITVTREMRPTGAWPSHFPRGYTGRKQPTALWPCSVRRGLTRRPDGRRRRRLTLPCTPHGSSGRPQCSPAVLAACPPKSPTSSPPASWELHSQLPTFPSRIFPQRPVDLPLRPFVRGAKSVRSRC
jgi:hypothetical protein